MLLLAAAVGGAIALTVVTALPSDAILESVEAPAAPEQVTVPDQTRTDTEPALDAPPPVPEPVISEPEKPDYTVLSAGSLERAEAETLVEIYLKKCGTKIREAGCSARFNPGLRTPTGENAGTTFINCDSTDGVIFECASPVGAQLVFFLEGCGVVAAPPQPGMGDRSIVIVEGAPSCEESIEVAGQVVRGEVEPPGALSEGIDLDGGWHCAAPRLDTYLPCHRGPDRIEARVPIVP